MNNFFAYDPSNLDKFDINLIESFSVINLLIITIPLLVWAIIYFIFPFIGWVIIVSYENHKKAKNRDKIRELILMKEVQWELEKEIEESMLNESISRASIN